jgi:putative SOS response-associated peptidase YedK
VVVEFWPEPEQDLVLACVWARWSAPGVPDLLSFAIITDDPPPEVRAVGHDRCVVPIRSKDIDTWLQPEKSTLEQLDAVLDPGARPFFRHTVQEVGEPGAADWVD